MLEKECKFIYRIAGDFIRSYEVNGKISADDELAFPELKEEISICKNLLLKLQGGENNEI